MYYHGSKTSGIKKLVPSKSLHEEDYVYLTTNWVVALIYTVNAIESFFEENTLKKPNKFQPWYSYGFNNDKLPVIEEYYPNATKETYSGKSGYIYMCKEPTEYDNPTNIHCAVTTKESVEIIEELFIPDVYLKLKEYEKRGLLMIRKFEDISPEYIERIHTHIKDDIIKYDLRNKMDNNYSIFIRNKFPSLLN